MPKILTAFENKPFVLIKWWKQALCTNDLWKMYCGAATKKCCTLSILCADQFPCHMCFVILWDVWCSVSSYLFSHYHNSQFKYRCSLEMPQFPLFCLCSMSVCSLSQMALVAKRSRCSALTWMIRCQLYDLIKNVTCWLTPLSFIQYPVYDESLSERLNNCVSAFTNEWYMIICL